MQTKMVSCGTRASARLPPHVLIILEPSTTRQAQQSEAQRGKHSKAGHSEAGQGGKTYSKARHSDAGQGGKAHRAGKHPVGATS